MAAGFPQTISQADQTITIDGKRTPEAIPDWVAWRHALRLIGETRERKSGLVEFIEADLALDEPDLKLLQIAAQKHLEREARAREWAARLGPEPREAAEGRAGRKHTVRAYETEFRLGLLADADELLTALSPKAKKKVQEWVQERKSTLVITLLKTELDWFRWPR